MSRAPDNPRLLLQRAMREDFGAFLRKAYPTIKGGERLLWNWHLAAIAYQLSQIMNGVSTRSLITMPPRSLKTIMISIAWVAWMLGRNPRLNFVCISYSTDLSASFGRKCQIIMESQWYRELFPRTIISAKRSAAHDFATTMGGGRLATSITGTLTGRGGDIVIIDDPIKPEEAYLESARDLVNRWFRSTAVTRLDNKVTGAMLIVMQRLHETILPAPRSQLAAGIICGCRQLLMKTNIPRSDGVSFIFAVPGKHYIPSASRSKFWSSCAPRWARCCSDRNTSKSRSPLSATSSKPIG